MDDKEKMVQQWKLDALVKKAVASYEEKEDERKKAPPEYTLSGMAHACLGCDYSKEPHCRPSTKKPLPLCLNRNSLLDMVRKASCASK